MVNSTDLWATGTPQGYDEVRRELSMDSTALATARSTEKGIHPGLVSSSWPLSTEGRDYVNAGLLSGGPRVLGSADMTNADASRSSHRYGQTNTRYLHRAHAHYTSCIVVK